MMMLTKRKRIVYLLLYFVVYLLGIQMLALPLMARLFNAQIAWIFYLIASFMIAAVIVVTSLDFIKDQWLRFKKRGSKRIPDIGFGLAGLFGISILFQLFITEPFQLETAANQQNNLTLMHYNPVFFALNAILIGPYLEEMIFRGCIYYPFHEKDYQKGLVLSALLFGLLHLAASVTSGDPRQLLYLFLYCGDGYVLGYLWHKTDSMFTGLWTHSIYNLIAFLLLIR